MRFVIHEHKTPDNSVHWDLMLEQGKTLKTFRLNRAPHHVTDTPCQAAPIFDHETRFLTYEGPVQQGQGRVKRVDRGAYQSIRRTEQTWTVRLDGDVLRACVKLPLLQEEALIIVNI